MTILAKGIGNERNEALDQQQIGWPAIIILYVATLASMALVGIVAALTLDLSTALGVARQDVGVALSVFSLPSALGALICGGIVDRVGPRRVILLSCIASAIGSLLAIAGGSFGALLLALAVSGIGFTGISVAAPAMIVNVAQAERRVRAMSIWSTYAPTAFATGLLLGAPFAGTMHWKPPLAIHAGMMAILATASLALPKLSVSAHLTPIHQLRQLASILREAPVLSLAVAVAVPSALSYGTSLIAPTYLAQVHGTSMAASATVVAAVKGVAMLLCGIATGLLLSRNFDTPRLFTGLVLLGLAAQVAIFWPGAGLSLAVIGLFAWLIAFGGMSATAMSLLPAVVRTPTESGAASGLIGQALSILSFLAPSVYFGMGHWTGYVALACAGLVISAIALLASWRTKPRP